MVEKKKVKFGMRLAEYCDICMWMIMKQDSAWAAGNPHTHEASNRLSKTTHSTRGESEYVKIHIFELWKRE